MRTATISPRRAAPAGPAPATCHTARVVLEVAVFEVTPATEDDFVAAYRRVPPEVAGAPGCQSVRMTRGVESPGRFVLLVEWDSVEAHEQSASGRPSGSPAGGPASGRTSPRRRRSSTTPTWAALVRVANVHPVQPADLALLRTPGSPTLSPDGRRAVVVVTRLDLDADEYRSRLWLVDTTGAAPPRPLTDGHRDSAPAWSPDGRWIAFLRAEKEGKPQLHLLPADTRRRPPGHHRRAAPARRGRAALESGLDPAGVRGAGARAGPVRHRGGRGTRPRSRRGGSRRCATGWTTSASWSTGGRTSSSSSRSGTSPPRCRSPTATTTTRTSAGPRPAGCCSPATGTPPTTPTCTAMCTHVRSTARSCAG